MPRDKLNLLLALLHLLERMHLELASMQHLLRLSQRSQQLQRLELLELTRTSSVARGPRLLVRAHLARVRARLRRISPCELADRLRPARNATHDGGHAGPGGMQGVMCGGMRGGGRGVVQSGRSGTHGGTGRRDAILPVDGSIFGRETDGSIFGKERLRRRGSQTRGRVPCRLRKD